MDDLKKTLKDIVKNNYDSNLEAAIDEGWYLDNVVGHARHKSDLRAPVDPAAAATPYADLAAAQARGYADLDYAKLTPHEKQLELAELSRGTIEGKVSSAKGFKLAVVGAATALVLAIGASFIDNEKPRHYMWSKRQIEEPVDAKNVYKGIATLLGAGALIVAAYGVMKRK
jgi:hypothetical protein